MDYSVIQSVYIQDLTLHGFFIVSIRLPFAKQIPLTFTCGRMFEKHVPWRNFLIKWNLHQGLANVSGTVKVAPAERYCYDDVDQTLLFLYAYSINFAF